MIEWIERYRLPAPASSVPGRLLPIVADTYDGSWADINGFHVRESHACAAVERATPGPLPKAMWRRRGEPGPPAAV